MSPYCCASRDIRCELQFDYGLRQKRSRKLEDRPMNFVTEAGKVISVDQQVAKVNDKVVKKGQVRLILMKWRCTKAKLPQVSSQGPGT